PSVLLRLKEDYDGAEPAASSVSVLNLLTFEHLLGPSTEGRQKVERTLGRFGSRIGAAARVVPMMLAGLSAWHAEHSEIVIVGGRGQEDTTALLREIARHYRPFATVLAIDPDKNGRALATLAPWTATMQARDDRATAYVCRAFTCQAP